MRVPNTVGWGIALALATAIISGFSVYLNGRFVKLFDDPTLLAAVRNGLVGLVLVGIAVGAGTLPAIRRLSGRERLGLLAIGIIGGGIPFALFFEGLALSYVAGRGGHPQDPVPVGRRTRRAVAGRTPGRACRSPRSSCSSPAP